MINLEYVKKRLNELQSKRVVSAPDSNQRLFWRPSPGKNQIRIVPYQFNKDCPFIELFLYYDLGPKSFLSLQTFNEPDPIVEFVKSLRQNYNKEDWELSKKLEPKFRVFVPIVVRGQEQEGVEFWGFGRMIYEELLGIIADPDYGDITDITSGRDIIIEYIPPKEAGNDFGKTTVRVKPNTTPLESNEALLKTFLQDQTDIFSIFRKPSYEELEAALKKWLAPKEEFPDENPDLEVTQPKVLKPQVSKKSLKTKQDISDEFDELFRTDK